MPNFTFDERDHAYYLYGQRIESITETIREAGLMGDYFPDPYYMAKGSAIHDAIELHFLGKLDREKLCQPGMLDITGYVDSALRYLDHERIEIDPNEVEIKLYDPVYLYAGRLDNLSGDWKSGAPARWHRLQVASQWNLAKVNHLDKAPNRTVYLHEDGSMATFKEYKYLELKQNLDTFLCALNINRWKSNSK